MSINLSAPEGRGVAAGMSTVTFILRAPAMTRLRMMAIIWAAAVLFLSVVVSRSAAGPDFRPRSCSTRARFLEDFSKQECAASMILASWSDRELVVPDRHNDA